MNWARELQQMARRPKTTIEPTFFFHKGAGVVVRFSQTVVLRNCLWEPVLPIASLFSKLLDGLRSQNCIFLQSYEDGQTHWY